MPEARLEWLEASEVIPMFPSLVWKLQLAPGLRERIGAQVLGLLDGMRRGAAPLAPGQGWQSERMLHSRPELGELASCVERAAVAVLRFLKIGCDALEITGCWASVLAEGAAHRSHHHPNNFLSAVYYLRVAPGADTINFHDPRPQTGVIRPPVTALSAENTDQVVVRVRSGTLLVFPSFLEHSVDPTAGGIERVSVSFNLMFPAFTETLAKPLW
jgi:uncharacterized protein (TIGR02466 family)